VRAGPAARWPAAAAAALVAAVPVVVDPGGHHRFTALRFFVAAVVVVIGLAVALGQRRGAVDRRIVGAWMIVAAVSVVATVAGQDPLLSLFGDPVRLMGLVTVPLLVGAFLVGAAAGDDGPTVVTNALLAGGVVVVAVGLAQWAGVLEHHGRPTSSLGNAGFLGAYLCLLVPVAVARVRCGGPLGRASGALAVAAVALLALSGTRGAWIGTAVGLATLFALDRRPRRVLVGGVLAVVAVGAVAALAVNRGTDRGRLDTWANTVPVITARPLAGWGPEGFRAAFAHTVSADWVRRYAGDGQIPDRAHNRFLDIAATTGLAGVAADVALLAAVALALRRGLTATRAEPQRWWPVAGIAAALVAWLAQGLFLFDTFDLAVVAWVLVGAVVAAAPPPDLGVAGRPVRGASAVLGLVVVALAATNLVADRRVQSASGQPGVVAIERLVGAAHLRPRAFDTYVLARSVAVNSGDRAVLERAHGLLKGWDDPDVRFADADVLARLGRLTESAAVSGVALRAAPRNPAGLLRFGQSLYALHRFAEARPPLEAAYALSPRSAAPPLALGLLAFAEGRPADGCRYFNIAARRPNAPATDDLRAAASAAGAPCTIP
jgi:O-antigen ligase